MTAALRGSTWDHPRAYQPLNWITAHPALGVPPIDWTVRSLSNFADQPLEELTGDHDLLVLDHPTIGRGASSGLLLDLSHVAAAPTDAVGPSADSYRWENGIFALPIDAACHVSAHRPDLLPADQMGSWAQVEDVAARMAATGRYLSIPQVPIDLWCLLVTLLASSGEAVFASQSLAPREVLSQAVRRIQHLAQLSHPAARDYNPIDLLGHMADGDDIVGCPALFGYVNYSTDGFARHLLAFGGLPSDSGRPPRAVVGGAGIAVSAASAHPETSVAAARALCSAAIQAGAYAAHGGQPAHRQAWGKQRGQQADARFLRLHPRHHGHRVSAPDLARVHRAVHRLRGTAEARSRRPCGPRHRQRRPDRHLSPRHTQHGDANVTSPLEGLLVADLSQLVQGPFATQILGDLGADVVKVEPVTGDWLRSYSMGDTYVAGESLSFLAFNRNKRSLAVNVKDASGYAAVRELLRRADVVVENFRPGVMDRLGLGYEVLAADNPGLVYCASSGYGPDGPYLHRPGQDLLAQALTGLPFLQGNADDPPTPVGIGIADVSAGLHIAYAVMAALVSRSTTGRGQRIDVSLLNSLLAVQGQELTWYLHTRTLPTRSTAGLGSPLAGAPLGIYPTADGWLAIAMSSVALLARLLDVPSLLSYDSKNVMGGRDEVKRLLEQATLRWTTAALLEHLLAADVWCAPVQDYSQVVEDPQIRHNGILTQFDHPTAGAVTTVGQPVRFSETVSTTQLAPPLLGQHSREVLTELCGLTAADVESLLSSGAVKETTADIRNG